MDANIPEVILQNVTLSTNLTIFYREAGSPQNPTIVFLHGFPSSSHQYRLLLPLLAASFHVIAWDYPCFGFSVAPENFEYSLSRSQIPLVISSMPSALRNMQYTYLITAPQFSLDTFYNS
jgi:pimeloyl-ACP methyl ester carboxylesterase